MNQSNDLLELQSAIREASLNDQVADELIKMGEKRAMKVLTKNKREIKRLELLAKEALVEGNKTSYIYAISKIRSIVRKPIDADIMETLWKTSRERVLELMQEGVAKYGQNV